ncbi:MAG: hypothetical protein ACEQSR_03700 [Candidatus Methylacidiphilales bacterium]
MVEDIRKKKDAEILEANPKASTQELLALGLSQEKYLDLLDEKKNDIDPELPKVVAVTKASFAANFPTKSNLSASYQERIRKLKSRIIK